MGKKPKKKSQSQSKQNNGRSNSGKQSAKNRPQKSTDKKIDSRANFQEIADSNDECSSREDLVIQNLSDSPLLHVGEGHHFHNDDVESSTHDDAQSKEEHYQLGKREIEEESKPSTSQTISATINTAGKSERHHFYKDDVKSSNHEAQSNAKPYQLENMEIEEEAKPNTSFKTVGKRKGHLFRKEDIDSTRHTHEAHRKEKCVELENMEIEVEAKPSTSRKIDASIKTPDANVEDTVAELEKKVLLLARRSKKLVLRPDRGGTIGKPTKLYTNHFEVQLTLESAFQYDIKINPEGSEKELPKDLRWKIFMQFTKQHANIFKVQQRKLLPVFDGVANFYTAEKLTLNTYTQSQEFAEAGRNLRKFLIIITFACTIDMAFDKYLRDHRSDFKIRDALRVLDTVLKNRSRESTIYSGRHVFSDGCPSEDVSGYMQIKTGHLASFRPCSNITLNLDISFKIFFKKKRVLDLLKIILNVQEIPSKLKIDEMETFIDVVRGLMIKTNHLGFEKKHRIKKFSDRTAANYVFEIGNERLTIQDYYKSKYNINLGYPNLPVLVLEGVQGATPMELCTVIEQANEKKLTPDQQRQMIKTSAKPPRERKRMIEDVRRTSNFDTNSYLNEFGITISKNLMHIKGRVLPVPVINEISGESGIGKYDLWRIHQYRKPSEMPDFCIVAPGRSANRNAALNFIRKLFESAHKKGLKWDENRGDFSNKLYELKDIENYVDRKIEEGFELLFWILPKQGASEWHDMIKKVCDPKIVTQCVTQNLVWQPRPDALQNIVLKLNIKLGGTSATLRLDDQTIYKDIFNRPFMIIGADVTHPSPSQKKMPSYAGVVGSVNRDLSQYGGLLRSQESKKEIIVDLKDMVHKLLVRFAKGNNQYPEKILYYRDGVSEGQFKIVLDEELDAILEACKEITAEIRTEYKPKITIITVQKRHNTRFFPMDAGVGKSGNIPAGTVVDQTIVHPFNYDFYLCSHEGIQGTSRPSHYCVLYDDNNFSSDFIQMFTYHICYTYGRCARSVSYPPPTYYAHHLCMRARNYQDDSLEFNDAESLISQTSSSSREVILENVMAALLEGRDCTIDNMDNMMYYI